MPFDQGGVEGPGCLYSEMVRNDGTVRDIVDADEANHFLLDGVGTANYHKAGRSGEKE